MTTREMLDTSVLLAGLSPDHVFHSLARPHVPIPGQTQLLGLVAVEAYARLRGKPFNATARSATSILRPYVESAVLLDTPSPLYARAIVDAAGLNLGAQIHDYLIVLTCAHHGCSLLTLDRRQAELARPVLEPLGLAVTLIA